MKSNSKHLEFMFVGAALRLALLRKGFKVEMESRAGGDKYDLLVARKGRSKKYVFALEFKAYEPESDRYRPTRNALFCDGDIPIYTVYVKRGGDEIIIDAPLAEIVGQIDTIKVTVRSAG